jgi:hypothetical protein
MPISRDVVKTYIIGMLADDLGIPTSHFSESDNLRNDYLFDDQSLVMFGKKINNAQWHSVYVTPPEIANCQTVGDVIDLVFGKVSGSGAAKAKQKSSLSKNQ